MKEKYRVIGIMSGTSLDGLDIAYCEFSKNKNWKFKIVFAETQKYSKKWYDKLNTAFKKDKEALTTLSNEYGKFIGKEVSKFVKRYPVKADFIASHGHTIFHNPATKITLQIGEGQCIAEVCKLPVVYDFRSGDVALGGQGAPLVPIVDKMLFSKEDACLNLGGFANISFDNAQKKRIAFDICPVNMVLNNLAQQLGKKFDKDGRLALKGKINEELLEHLNALSFYKANPPKSLGREWVEKYFSPILKSYNISIQDKLRTVAEHIAMQIAIVINRQVGKENQSVLITGGGVYNKFLMQRLKLHVKCKLYIPEDNAIQFKEAMAFAFLGVLRRRNEINILNSVTGAKRSSSGGSICYPY